MVMLGRRSLMIAGAAAAAELTMAANLLHADSRGADPLSGPEHQDARSALSAA